jgi:hypothetical protein
VYSGDARKLKMDALSRSGDQAFVEAFDTSL